MIALLAGLAFGVIAHVLPILVRIAANERARYSQVGDDMRIGSER